MNSKVLKKRSLFRDEICERIEEAIFTGELKAGDRIVITGGITNGISGNTNLIKVDTI